MSLDPLGIYVALTLFAYVIMAVAMSFGAKNVSGNHLHSLVVWGTILWPIVFAALLIEWVLGRIEVALK